MGCIDVMGLINPAAARESLAEGWGKQCRAACYEAPYTDKELHVWAIPAVLFTENDVLTIM